MRITLNPKEIRDQDRFNVLSAHTPNKRRRWFVRPQVALIHATVSGTALGTLEWFKNPKSGVSSDFVIDKQGRIWRPVPRGWYSFHAGQCTFRGVVRKDYNKLAYGIELVNRNNGEDPYPEIQLRALAFVLATIKAEAPSVCYVRRHADVAYPRGRKSDPKGLSISDIYGAVRDWQPDLWLE